MTPPCDFQCQVGAGVGGAGGFQHGPPSSRFVGVIMTQSTSASSRAWIRLVALLLPIMLCNAPLRLPACTMDTERLSRPVLLSAALQPEQAEQGLLSSSSSFSFQCCAGHQGCWRDRWTRCDAHHQRAHGSSHRLRPGQEGDLRRREERAQCCACSMCALACLRGPAGLPCSMWLY